MKTKLNKNPKITTILNVTMQTRWLHEKNGAKLTTLWREIKRQIDGDGNMKLICHIMGKN